MIERTEIFVDTSYLLASFYNSWTSGARAQLEIDLPGVVSTLDRMITRHLNQKVHRQLWYDGIPDAGPHKYQRTLRTCDGVQLRTGHLIEVGERRTQKAVDTRLVADLVITAMQRRYSDIVIVSGDADMIPGVEEAVNAGIRVHLYGFGWDSMSSALRHLCDTVTILDPREDFADCMELQPLEGPLPPTICTDEEENPEENSLVIAEVESIELELETEAEAESQAEANTEAESQADTEETVETADIETNESTEVELIKPEEKEPQESPAPLPAEMEEKPKPTPKPSMMAPRRKLQSRYIPLPNELWVSAGFQTPFDVGQQYATWWYHNVADQEQRDNAHVLCGGGLPAEIDRPLLQFACESLNEYSLSETQRVGLRDGFHSGIRTLLINMNKN